MSGTFIIGEQKIRPGQYFRREKVGNDVVPGIINGIGAGLIRADWGPLNQVVDISSSTAATAIFGTGQTVDLIAEMFAGGISSGKFVRIGTGGTAPSLTLKNAADADYVTITSDYAGTRQFSATIKTNLADNTKKDFIMYEGMTEYLKASFVADGTDDGKNLVNVINTLNRGFTAKLVDSATGAIADITQAEFTGGVNPTATTAQYKAGLDLLEASIFNVICVDTSDTAVHALLAEYVDRMYDAGAFVLACIAGTKEMTFDEKIATAAAYNNEKLHYCVNAASDSSGNIYDSYRLAARIGGAIAAAPSTESLTHSVIKGFTEIAEPLTNTQIDTALQSGCIVLSESTVAKGQIWIEQGINTLVNLPDDMDAGWKKIRRVKTRFELMQRLNAATSALIGKVDGDNDGIATIIATGNSVAKTMIGEKKVLSGTEFYVDTENPAVGDSAWFVIAVVDRDSAEKLYMRYQFSFSQS